MACVLGLVFSCSRLTSQLLHALVTSNSVCASFSAVPLWCCCAVQCVYQHSMLVVCRSYLCTSVLALAKAPILCAARLPHSACCACFPVVSVVWLAGCLAVWSSL